ncbi:MAG: hypothetical protein HYV63_32685 [Candidatus Schekmanbacteria bacterium]|nr:hypothetical protein [Candidatus Schekmanbacteria bacterium]
MRRRWGARWLALAAPLAFIGAMTAASFTALTQAAMPEGDYAVNAMYVRQAAKLELLTGAYSRFGFHHPGPLAFYALAVAMRAVGGEGLSSLLLGQGLISFLWMLAAMWMLVTSPRRGTGEVLLFCACCWALFRPLGSLFLYNPWGPAQAVLPVLCAVLAAQRVARGEGRALPMLLGATLYGVSAHLGTIPVLFSVATCAVAVGLLRPRLLWRTPARRRRACLVAAVSAALAAVAVGPPLAEELSRPCGNLCRLLAVAVAPTTAAPRAAWEEAIAVASRAYLPRAAVGWLGPWSVLLISILALLPALHRNWPGRRYRTDSLILTVAIAAGLMSAASVPGEVHRYLFWFMQALAALMWFHFARYGVITRVPLVLRRWPWWNRLAAAGMIPLSAAAGADYEVKVPVNRNLHAISRALPRTWPGGSLVWWELDAAEGGQWAAGAGIVNNLDARGVDVAINPEWAFMLGERFAPPAGGRTTRTPLVVSEANGATSTIHAGMYSAGETTVEWGWPRVPLRIDAGASAGVLPRWRRVAFAGGVYPLARGATADIRVFLGPLPPGAEGSPRKPSTSLPRACGERNGGGPCRADIESAVDLGLHGVLRLRAGQACRLQIVVNGRPRGIAPLGPHGGADTALPLALAGFASWRLNTLSLVPSDCAVPGASCPAVGDACGGLAFVSLELTVVR